MTTECFKPKLKVQQQDMRCISCALEYRRRKIGQMIEEDIPFGNGEGMHKARTEGPVPGMQCISAALEYRRMKIGWMIEEDMLLDDGKGMQIARIEFPAAWYALYLLSLGIKEEEDSMDD
jgi:hypothetical protein